MRGSERSEEQAGCKRGRDAMALLTSSRTRADGEREKWKQSRGELDKSAQWLTGARGRRRASSSTVGSLHSPARVHQCRCLLPLPARCSASGAFSRCSIVPSGTRQDIAWPQLGGACQKHKKGGFMQGSKENDQGDAAGGWPAPPLFSGSALIGWRPPAGALFKTRASSAEAVAPPPICRRPLGRPMPSPRGPAVASASGTKLPPGLPPPAPEGGKPGPAPPRRLTAAARGGM